MEEALAKRIPQVSGNYDLDKSVGISARVCRSGIHPLMIGLSATFDDAFQKQNKKGAYDCVLQDGEGHMVGCKFQTLQYCTSVALVKALGLRGALQLAKKKRIPKVIIEGDAKTIMDMVNGLQTTAQEVATVIGDILELSTSFVNRLYFCS
ncbi:conserved hypothetical protein [Ricinus communis]|uniref:RNase H type-1 domain-containing protein n=1 Tax=Ricinus communis TaxID=3988 RepID=B9SNZ4_RICCO|nr:conserved hypothetical protein [Ricinus communis]